MSDSSFTTAPNDLDEGIIMRPSVVFASPRVIPSLNRLMTKTRNLSDPQFTSIPPSVHHQLQQQQHNGCFLATPTTAEIVESGRRHLYRSVSKVTLSNIFSGRKNGNGSPVHSVHAGVIPTSLNQQQQQRNNDSLTRYPSEEDLTSTIEVDSQHEFEATAEGICNWHLRKWSFHFISGFLNEICIRKFIERN